MDTQNNTQVSFRTRLIVFALVLAIGFVSGWFNGRTGSSTSQGSTDVAAEQTRDATQEESESATQATPADEDSSPSENASASEQEAPAPSTNDNASRDSGTSTVAPERGPTVEEDGAYTTKDEVALYIHTYGHLPRNFISKTKARQRGWVASEGNLDEVCPGMSIGGSEFYNDEGQLPDKRGRRWTECDINYHGGYRGAERIVFSNDGLIFYTADHYETFEQLY